MANLVKPPGGTGMGYGFTAQMRAFPSRRIFLQGTWI